MIAHEFACLGPLNPAQNITQNLEMSIISNTLLFVLAASVAAQNTLTSPVDVARAAATALTNSPTSNVKGNVFDRIAIIWLENTDYDKAAGDRKEADSFLLSMLFQ